MISQVETSRKEVILMKYEKPEVCVASALAVVKGHNKTDTIAMEVPGVYVFTPAAYEADE